MTRLLGDRWVRVFGQPDLALAALVAMTALVATTLGISPVLRVFVAVPLVLFLPGYGLTSAIFPALVLPAVERLLISVGLSISVTILVGLGLAAIGIPLSPITWAIVLAVFTLASSGVAWVRRVRRNLVGPGMTVARMPRSGVAMVLIAALVAAEVLLGSRLIATDQEAPAPAQLWLVPIAGQPNDALLGVRAGENAADYRIVISVASDPIYEFELELTAGETWERHVNFSADLRAQPIVARLYQGSSQAESRFVVLQPQTNDT